MKQLVIRILWPQAQSQDMSLWQCEYAASGFEAVPGPLPEWSLETVVLGEVLPRVAALQAPGVQLVMILPAELVLYDSVTLPARQHRQALQALPFLVEEWLADDIETVHLAIGTRQAAGTWPVMVIARHWMESFRALIDQHGVKPHALHVDAQCLPLPAGARSLAILMQGERALVRTERVVSAVELDNLAPIIHLLTRNAEFQQVQIHHEEGHEQQAIIAQQLATEMAALDEVQTRVEPLASSLTVFLAGTLDKPGAINLLQGEFLVQQPTRGLHWGQLAAAVVLFGLLGQSTLQLVSGWYFSHAGATLEKQLEAQYRELYPDARQVSNPRKRLTSKLAELGMGGNDASFAYVFGTSIKALQSLQDASGLVIQQLRYQSKQGELELEVTARNIEQLDQYKQLLVKAGLQAEIASANEGEGGIMGRIQIKSGT